LYYQDLQPKKETFLEVNKQSYCPVNELEAESKFRPFKFKVD